MNISTTKSDMALKFSSFLKITLFIYFWPCWVFVAVQAFSLVPVSGGYCLAAMCGLLTVVASLVKEHGLRNCSSWALKRRLSGYDTRAYLHRDMWDLPGPGTKPVSPELAGRFFTTEPPEQP